MPRHKGMRNRSRRRGMTTNPKRLREQKSDLYRQKEESIPVSQQPEPDQEPNQLNKLLDSICNVFHQDESYLGEETLRKLREREQNGLIEESPEGEMTPEARLGLTEPTEDDPVSKNEPEAPRGWAGWADPALLEWWRRLSGEWSKELEPGDTHTLPDSSGSPEHE